MMLGVLGQSLDPLISSLNAQCPSGYYFAGQPAIAYASGTAPPPDPGVIQIPGGECRPVSNLKCYNAAGQYIAPTDVHGQGCPPGFQACPPGYVMDSTGACTFTATPTNLNPPPGTPYTPGTATRVSTVLATPSQLLGVGSGWDQAVTPILVGAGLLLLLLLTRTS